MQPYFGDEEKKIIMEYLNQNPFLTEYKKTEEFEKIIANYVGVKHCIVVNNGTVSLMLAAMAAGIGIGDEVLIPNYTMIATPNSIKILGANPIFIDVDPDTLCLDVDHIQSNISSKTKAIMLVTANGRYPKVGIKKFEELCAENNLILIEDAAQSLGSFYPDGRHIGTAGLIGSFSFSTPKIISTGQGGALVTNDDEIAIKVRKLKDFGRTKGGNDIHDIIGFNFKFTDLQACVGIAQMRKLSERVIRKKALFEEYSKELNNIEEIKLFNHDLDNTSPWFIDCLAKNRNSLIQFLLDNGIGSRVMYPPINKQLAYSYPGNFPVSDKIGEFGLWLPSSVQLSNDEVKKICKTIKKFYVSNKIK